MTTTEELEARVERGAEWLDKRTPGWEDRIFLEEFNMDSAFHCVLGQVYGNFFTFVTRKRLFGDARESIDWAVDHGFFAEECQLLTTPAARRAKRSQWIETEKIWVLTILDRRCKSASRTKSPTNQDSTTA